MVAMFPNLGHKVRGQGFLFIHHFSPVSDLKPTGTTPRPSVQAGMRYLLTSQTHSQAASQLPPHPHSTMTPHPTQHHHTPSTNAPTYTHTHTWMIDNP